MSNGYPFSLLNDEQMSNKVRVKHQPEKRHLGPIGCSKFFQEMLQVIPAFSIEIVPPLFRCFFTQKKKATPKFLVVQKIPLPPPFLAVFSAAFRDDDDDDDDVDDDAIGKMMMNSIWGFSKKCPHPYEQKALIFMDQGIRIQAPGVQRHATWRRMCCMASEEFVVHHCFRLGQMEKI